METKYRALDQPNQSSKRGGVFLTCKSIAVVAVIVLVVVIVLVLLATFLGPGRKSSSSEGKACNIRYKDQCLFYRGRETDTSFARTVFLSLS